MTWTTEGSRIQFRPITEDDAELITRWRNSASAREAFFSTEVVTPDTHREFVRSRKPHDLIWVIERLNGSPIGMLSLTVDTQKHTGEYGRAFLDPAYRGQGYWLETEWSLLWYAFEQLRLQSVWLAIVADNEAMIAIHDRLGWRRVGVDLEGHRHPRCPVLVMEYDAEEWTTSRETIRETVRARREVPAEPFSGVAHLHVAAVARSA